MNKYIFSAKLAGWLMFNESVPKNIRKDSKDERFWVFIFEESDNLERLIKMYKEECLKEKRR